MNEVLSIALIDFMARKQEYCPENSVDKTDEHCNMITINCEYNYTVFRNFLLFVKSYLNA